MASDLIFEIGAEELPASFILPALRALEASFTEQAKELRLSHGRVETHGTPRRLALLVRDVAERAEDVEERAEGPAVSVAFDAEGKPTRAAEGFARKFGLTVDQLERAQTAQGERLIATRRQEGQPALRLLQNVLPQLIEAAADASRKTMRWADLNVVFPRPVRWLCAVLGGEVVPVSFGFATSSAATYGHRFLAPGAIRLERCDDYLPRLREAKVLASIAERRERVVAEIDRVAAEAGGRRVEDDELVDTITGLVEWPSGVLGSFSPDALDMPREVLISEMRGHQKYASLETPGGRLMPSFCAVANTPVKDVEVSRRGYERVLRARLADARFFFDEDRTRPLASRVNDLRRVTFQERLGTIHDKLERMLGIARAVAAGIGYGDDEAVARSVQLSKADLTTGMVGEFPELQGVMGREYARHDGERDDVSVAVFEHYLPRSAGDVLPASSLGAIVGIADRLDTLTGFAALGQLPKGSDDKFGLRRAALAIIRILTAHGYRLSLGRLIDAALDQHYARFERLAADAPAPAPDAKGRERRRQQLDRAEAREQILEFVRARLRPLWTEEHAPDVVEAIIAVGFDDLADASQRLLAVSRMTRRADFTQLAIAFGRASNIIEKQAKDLAPGEPDPALFRDEPESRLFEASSAANAQVEQALATGDYDEALRALADLRPAVDAFFDKVLVMADDADLRRNRLRLVRGVQRLFAPIADFARIHTK